MKRLKEILIIVSVIISGCDKNNPVSSDANNYPIHHNISATFFYIGEPADSDNGYISNAESSWDVNWEAHYGGVDNPGSRSGYFPAAFTPKENPFYFALPYDDFNENGNRRPGAHNIIYWAKDKSWSSNESMCKNQWIKITKGDKLVYAQWEDCGPYFYDDSNYVFGIDQPRNQTLNNSSGLDVSPAVRDYLGLTGLDTVSWQFVNQKDVPYGIWKFIVTTSQVDWGAPKRSRRN